MEPQHRTPCAGCARPLRQQDEWCPLCLERAPDPRFRTGGAPPAARADDLAGPAGAPLQTRPHSRWAVSEITFGPVGRVLWTVGLLVLTGWLFRFSPLAGVVFAVTALPVALRDVWRRVRR
ncbi:hypothetical protein [Kineococcus auxinigenes]|uniref:hypothetical protein n=1 Tax=unclassified Kineococcus TaxID=2621656 RepID=UPI003D7E50C9